jgi:hypothetical protein
MTDPIILADHAGVPLTHGNPRVNGVDIHYAIGGSGEPVFLLHGGTEALMLPAESYAPYRQRCWPLSRNGLVYCGRLSQV